MQAAGVLLNTGPISIIVVRIIHFHTNTEKNMVWVKRCWSYPLKSVSNLGTSVCSIMAVHHYLCDFSQMYLPAVSFILYFLLCLVEWRPSTMMLQHYHLFEKSVSVSYNLNVFFSFFDLLFSVWIKVKNTTLTKSLVFLRLFLVSFRGADFKWK